MNTGTIEHIKEQTRKFKSVTWVCEEELSGEDIHGLYRSGYEIIGYFHNYGWPAIPKGTPFELVCFVSHNPNPSTVMVIDKYGCYSEQKTLV